MTLQTLRVLNALLQDPSEARYGLELSSHAGLKSGSLYPILARLESAGWIESDWEEQDASQLGRPRRRYYRLTGVGARESRLHLAEFRQTENLRGPIGAPVPGFNVSWGGAQ